jgi:hypothetical protein
MHTTTTSVISSQNCLHVLMYSFFLQFKLINIVAIVGY